MDRRLFLSTLAGAGLAGTILPAEGTGFRGGRPFADRDRELAPEGNDLEADVLIVGGGLGGCAAALSALRRGHSVVLTEPTGWIGGQLTSQAVPPDEHPWIESMGAPASYHRLRRGIRTYYRRWYSLTEEARTAEHLNPGNCGVSRICHEPRVALSVLESMLQPHRSRDALTLLLHHEATGAEMDGDRVRTVTLRDRRDGTGRTVRAPYVLDATETGALLPLTGTEYVTGAEARAETGELHAPRKARPDDWQAITWCFAAEYRPGEDHTIERPENYAFWRDFVPDLDPPWPGRLLSLTYSNPRTLEPRSLAFDPRPGAQTNAYNLWTYRRLLDPSLFRPDDRRGVTLTNWPQNDYFLRPVVGRPGAGADSNVEEALAEARGLARSLLYWLQTEAPRPEGGTGWPGLAPRGDLTGTEDGLAKRPYIRESRRIKPVFKVLEQHVGLEARMEATGEEEGEVTAARFSDSVGIGSYRIDLHPSTAGQNYLDVSSLPFEIPLGALLPSRMQNLLPACKNVGTSHITNGCYRLHPVEWSIGEAAGLLASYCLEEDVRPHAVRAEENELDAFQKMLRAEGMPLRWPEEQARTPQ